MEDVKPVTETSDKLDLKSEIQLLKLAKEALDLQLISHLEERSKTCSQDLQHLMGNLQNKLKESTQLSVEYMDSIHTVAGDVQVSVNAAVNVMSQLLNKMNDLNEEMKPVTEIAAQIRDISNTLKLLENAVAKLLKNAALADKKKE